MKKENITWNDFLGVDIPQRNKTKLSEANFWLLIEWHPTKNNKLTPNDLSINSGKKVWWKCYKNKDHEWEATVNNRNKGQGCPHCYRKSKEKASYNDAKKEAYKLNLKHKNEWRRYTQNKCFNKYIFPRNPYDYYRRRNEWVSWDDFLGIEIC